MTNQNLSRSTPGRPHRTALALTLTIIAAALLAPAASASDWSILPVTAAHSEPASLSGVSCSSPDACTVVGGHFVRGLQAGLAERFNGTRFIPQPVVLPGPASDLTLNAVSCPTAGFCVATGSVDTDDGIVEQWNGHRWAAVKVPSVEGDDTVASAVSCTSASNCLVDGASTDLMNIASSAHWNGHAWKNVNVSDPYTPAVDDGNDWSIGDVSCATVDFCLTLGDFANYNSFIPSVATGPTASLSTLACKRSGTQDCPSSYRWNGTKLTQVSTAPGLAAISCVSPTNCTAVGGSDHAHWNGRAWVDKRPLPHAAGAHIDAVSCPTAQMCVAVGTSAQGRVMVKVQRGGVWTSPPVPTPHGVTHVVVSAVSCAAADSCLLVGTAKRGGANTPLVERMS